MKYIISFESLLNYNVDIFTLNQVGKFYDKFNQNHPEYDIKSKIHYFDYSDFNPWFASENFQETCIFIIAYNDSDILGICKFAFWDLTQTYAISYLSTNQDYLHLGISKKILEKLFDYFYKTYPNEILNFSGYSVEGWKYLRKHILELSQKYNVKIKEKGIDSLTNYEKDALSEYSKK